MPSNSGLVLRRSVLLFAATMLLAVVVAPVASASWLSPETISPVAQSAAYPSVVTNASGGAVAVWSAYTDGVQVSDRLAGGQWTAPAGLSTPGAQVSSWPVVIDAAGTITALWGEYTMDTSGPMMPTMGPTTIFTARRPAGGSWSARGQLSTPGVSAGQAGLAVGADGRVAAVWGEGPALKSATRSIAGAWSAVDTVAASGATNAVPVVAVDEDGTVTTAWQSDTNSVRTATQAAGGAWSAPVDVSTSFSVAPVLAMNANGDATLVWHGVVAGAHTIFSARRPTAAGAWSAPTQISVTTATTLYDPVVTVDADGRATAAWAQFMTAGGSHYDQNVATRAADGTWGAPVALGVGTSDLLSVSAAGAGDVTLVWRGLVSGSFVVQSSRHAPGAAWSTPATLTALGNGFPVVSVDEQGNSVIVAAPSPSQRVVALTDDVSGPLLHAVSIPASAAAGATVTFGVSPLDVWSALGTTTWDFGDGSTATGTTPTHRYTTTGNKTVTVTATDALGNATIQTAALTVTAGAATGPDSIPGDSAAVGPTTTDPAAPIALRPDRPRATLLLASHQRITTLLARRAIRTSCQLTQAGTCRVVARVDAATARELHLRSRTLGSVTARLRPGTSRVLNIALGPKLRQRLRRLDTLVVSLTATSTTADHPAATATQTLTSAR